MSALIKELRKGNIVFSHTQNLPVPVQGILADKCITEGGVSEEWEKVLPVPLDEEWLKKYDFVPYLRKDMPQTRFFKNKIILSQHKNYYSYFVNGGVGGDTFYTNIKYVHQLQNLYFFLAAQELC